MRGIHLHQPVIYAQHPTPFIPIGVYGFRRQATFLLYNGFQQCRVNLVYGPRFIKTKCLCRRGHAHGKPESHHCHDICSLNAEKEKPAFPASKGLKH
nr:hypothetical protein [Candidatus Hamiltonella defensa]